MTPEKIYEGVIGELEGHCASHTDMHGTEYKAIYKRAWIRAITESVAAERERCAKIVEDRVRIADGMWDIAAEIRKGS